MMLDRTVVCTSSQSFVVVARQVRLIVMAIMMLLLSACASNVVVKSNFPQPLVQSLPLDGALAFTPEFKSYKYFEDAKARRTIKSFDMAESQVSLFESIFSNLINLVNPETADKDLVIEPEVLDFQYSAPAETQLKHYEVWIKYRLKISNGLEQKIADWTVKGYGKTPTSLLTTAGSAFNAAANVALRDVGAQLAIQFPKQKVIKELLNGESPDVIEEPQPDLKEPQPVVDKPEPVPEKPQPANEERKIQLEPKVKSEVQKNEEASSKKVIVEKTAEDVNKIDNNSKWELKDEA